MKKLFLFTVLLIFACSSDDSVDNSIDAVLVERFERSFIDNNPNSSTFGEQYQSVYSYNYDGNKLTSVDLEIISEGMLIIEQDATIRAEMKTEEVIVHGKITGKIIIFVTN